MQQEQFAAQHVQQNPVQPPTSPAQAPDPIQPPALPAQELNPAQPVQIQVKQGQPQLNWSYFKPEFSGKPEEDAEAHLLRTND